MIGDVLPTQIRGLLLVAGTALVAACAVDPYTGAIVPCCAPAPAYSGPGPGGPPPGYGQPQGQAGMEQGGPGWNGPGPGPQGAMEGPRGGGGGGGHLARRFAEANVTQDGRLTLQQAQAAHWRRVATNFASIDVEHKGFVTLDEIRAWRAANRGGRGGGYPPPGAGGPSGYSPQGYSGPPPGAGYSPEEQDGMEQ